MSNKLVIYDAENKQWLRFRSPEMVVRADRLSEVVPKFAEVNARIRARKLYGAGFISYEAAPAFEESLHTHSLDSFPLLWFGLYQKPEVIQLPEAYGNYHLNWYPSVSREAYDLAIATIKEQIARGETYQVNYTLRLHAPFAGNPYSLFLKLARSQQANYAAYVETDRFAICSASPELFFRLSGKQLTCRPMKGTAARGLTLAEDNMMAEWLAYSEKNRAENVMIVDMIRNDMGRVAEIGSVGVPSLFDVERYPTLWQMTSTVTATASASIDEIVAALFPCASITGAPKSRTMEIIHDLERTPRRIYTGCIGFISPQRQAQFNVAIRTVLIDKQAGKAEYGVGSGIVWDSVSQEEYVECQVKAGVLTINRPNFSLLETMLWTPDTGYFLLSYHLQRLQDSAIYFSISCELEEVKNQLDTLATSLPHEPHKVRLQVAHDGNITWEATTLDATTEPVRLSLAASPVDATNPFLYHKTTNRQVYDRARSAGLDCDDFLLYNHRGEITETCFGNIVVQMHGELLTPPVKCGLLPGTFRAHLLARGKVREQTIALEALPKCDRIHVVNSVRKWCSAILNNSHLHSYKTILSVKGGYNHFKHHVFSRF
ncbi:MAG: aminodeoxychorismate synthase component I [Hormoscilla sp. SP12CHS1]|nr:aminodeoxychorismate synthase component I [Hormoscilla sp. SP12CHS1]